MSRPLDVDGLLNDGFNAVFPVKGRLIDAAVLFADLSSFSLRSKDLSPIETLILANNFFTWISVEGIREGTGIVDKYIGDEVMVIFAKEFGSDDPFADAVHAGRRMAEKDYLGFEPHLGVAAGGVVVGYVGTPLKYNCSVYGRAVTLARRCCQTPPNGPTGLRGSSSIIFPAALWRGREIRDVLKPDKRKLDDGSIVEEEVNWELLPARNVEPKSGENLEVLELALKTATHPARAPEDHARELFAVLQREGSYRPRSYRFEKVPDCLRGTGSPPTTKS